MKGTVYLIHLERKIAHAQHYIGWAKFYIQRIIGTEQARSF